MPSTSALQPLAQREFIKRPVEFRFILPVAQDRNPRAIARFQYPIAINEHAVERGCVRVCEYRQRCVAQVAVIALEQGQTHGCGNIRAGGDGMRGSTRWRALASVAQCCGQNRIDAPGFLQERIVSERRAHDAQATLAAQAFDQCHGF